MNDLLKQIENNRKIICVTGPLASGKTVTTSVLANELKASLNAELYSNYQLENSKDVSRLQEENLDSDQYKIICLDEIEYVLHFSPEQFDELLEDSLDKKVILILESFGMDRLPDYLRKQVDIHLAVSRDEQSPSSIQLNGVNISFKQAIELEHFQLAFGTPSFLLNAQLSS